jgi:potassium efflux system protein
VLQERILLLDEYDKASKRLKKAGHTEPSPEKQAVEARLELVRLRALLARAATNPEVLLPPTFQGSGTGDKPSVNAEMKEAIEAAAGDVKECNAKLESMRAEAANWEARQNARRAERDKLFQTVAAMHAQGPEQGEASASAMASTAARRLSQERLINAGWKSRLEAIRLKAVEAEIALEARLAGAREVSIQVGQAQVQVAEKTLELMQARYIAAADRQERFLKEKAAAEESKAQRSDDPLERFRASRRAELLDVEAQVVKLEQALATSPPPSLEEQLSLADHADADFAQIKALLDDGRVSRLDAIRLTNDFRRIGPERERLLRNEMAIVELRLQFYEDALTAVELELLQDSLRDRYEQELLLQRLPPGRRAEAERFLEDHERRHRALLLRHRSVLERLTACTAQTLDQVARRLAILDEEYGFIRTHVFWVRDQEPIGLGTITQGAREGRQLLRGLLRLAREAIRTRQWGRASAEFITAALAVLGLPIGLFRARRMLKAQIAHDLAPDRPQPA